jgi:hypothetical protein
MKCQAIIISSLFLFFGCTHKDVQIDAVLNKAKDNRIELEKVLAHYSNDKSDSLKLIAANYLIKNMQLAISV